MDFSTLKTRVANETGLDPTADDTILGAWVNSAYQQVNGIFNWPWLLKPGTIQTIADITTGTATVTAGATAVTLSVAPTQSVATQYMIQFPTVSDDWYIISAHTAATTSLTLANAFVGTSNLTAGRYIIRKVLYSLPSDLDRIVDLRQTITDQKLGAIDVRTFDRYLPDPTATGTPCYYALCGLDSNKYWQITLYPIPSAVVNIQIRYLMAPAALSSSGDVPFIPLKFHDILVFGALWLFGHAYIDDSRITSAKARFDEILKQMTENYSPVPDQMTVIQPWDTRPRRLTGQLMFPPNFPINFSGF